MGGVVHGGGAEVRVGQTTGRLRVERRKPTGGGNEAFQGAGEYPQ